MTADLCHPMRNASRNGSELPSPRQADCSICSTPLPSARARFCSAACRQRAFRLRQADRSLPEDGRLREALRRQRRLVAQTVYACPSCDERFLGLRRCPDCHLFTRALGLGGSCPECDQVILLADLLGEEVLP
jgi:hypothetical protein